MTDFTTATSAAGAPDRTPRRVRHELRFRQLTVKTVQRITPHLIRITLTGDDLAGFTSLGFDDHSKVFFPDAATGQLTLPTVGPDGPVWPATQWAEGAKPGDVLGVGGPRGSFIVPTEFDWHLLIGDDTALPAIARRLAELPAGARVVVLAEVDSEADQIPFETQAELTLQWVHRRGAEPGVSPVLIDSLKTMKLPAGDFHAWVGCESAIAKSLRAHLVGERGANPKWVRASGYWRRGAVATHDTHDE
jgi:NADPH-dependent ferric siderophore reductase